MMLFSLCISLLVAFATGYFAVNMFWPDQLTGRSMFYFKMCTAAGVGFGITSLVYFVSAVFWSTASAKYYALETMVFVLLMVAFVYQRRSAEGWLHKTVHHECPATSRVHVLISIGFYALIIIAVMRFILATIKMPHGEWDAWAIWNLRARFLVRGGESWRDAFSPLIGWTHPDYPLLLPTSIARLWRYSAGETLIAPAFLSLFYTISPVVLIFAALTTLKSKAQGLLAVAVLLSIPFYIGLGASQYADTPLSFYFVITVILLSLHDTSTIGYPALLFLAGLTAGFAAWTKNEGMLFIIAVAAARFLVISKQKGLRDFLREIAVFGTGLLPGVTALTYFKIFLAPPNDLINLSQSQSLLSKLTDYSRYMEVGKVSFNKLVHSDWVYALVLFIGYALISGNRIDKKEKMTTWLLFLTLAIMAIGYGLIYVVASDNISWHVGRSLNRLVLQLWPIIVFASFMALSVKEPKLQETTVSNPSIYGKGRFPSQSG